MTEVKMKVVGIGGSPRLKGNSNYLLDQVLDELASHGVETEKIILNEYKIGPCQAHDNCHDVTECLQQDDAPWILKKFSQADGVVVASPVYFGTISAQVKTFMDRSFFLFGHHIQMKAKCYGLIAIAGRGGFNEAIEELKKFTGGPPGTSQAKVLILKGPVGGPDKHVKDNPEMVKQARDMGKQMAEILSQ
jgi:multimeric flavodoxin WrbA